MSGSESAPARGQTAGRAPCEDEALARAVELARRGPPGENPRVGCVLLDPAGYVVGEGWHEGAGTPHAEVAALDVAGDRARGATAVVTLEPCNHTGRTGPCTAALLDAGITRVVFAVRDPDPSAAGGADHLRESGVEVAPAAAGQAQTEAAALIRPWAFAVTHGRPHVTWKIAATLDGRVAAADGSSRWITGPAARADGHTLRAEVDTVLVGTGTALADDPQLTVRDQAGRPADRQPRRAVMGRRPLPPSSHLSSDPPAVRLDTHDPAEALDQLWRLGARHVLLEGGPTVAAAFVRAGLVDEVVAYVAGAVLGAGPPAVAAIGIDTINAALRFELERATVLGDDVRLVLRPRSAASTVRP